MEKQQAKKHLKPPEAERGEEAWPHRAIIVNVALLATGFRISGLQKCKRISSCHFKPSHLWSCVMIVLGWNGFLWYCSGRGRGGGTTLQPLQEWSPGSPPGLCLEKSSAFLLLVDRSSDDIKYPLIPAWLGGARVPRYCSWHGFFRSCGWRRPCYSWEVLKVLTPVSPPLRLPWWGRNVRPCYCRGGAQVQAPFVVSLTLQAP